MGTTRNVGLNTSCCLCISNHIHTYDYDINIIKVDSGLIKILINFTLKGPEFGLIGNAK